ncbi:MAG: hypothetical protein KGH69_05140 [Candidatus Micrarchaeota archaeon]|nr:hypothetical protein [Candidatus Micrarchaeota archaeon]
MGNFERIVISCMDRRLSEYLDSKYNDGRTVFLRNAGANIGTLSKSIEGIIGSGGISSVVIAPHTDCGAMGLVSSALSGSAKVSESIERNLVARFRKISYSDRNELERIVNPALQERGLSNLVKRPDIGTAVELIDLSRMQIPKDDGKHLLTFTKPSPTRYSSFISKYGNSGIGMFNSYFIQASAARDVSADIEIATAALHISDVRLVSENQLQNAGINEDMNYIKGMSHFSGFSISEITA